MVKAFTYGIVAGVILTLTARHQLIRYSQHSLPKPDYMGVKFLRSIQGVPAAWGIA